MATELVSGPVLWASAFALTLACVSSDDSSGPRGEGAGGATQSGMGGSVATSTGGAGPAATSGAAGAGGALGTAGSGVGAGTAGSASTAGGSGGASGQGGKTGSGGVAGSSGTAGGGGGSGGSGGNAGAGGSRDAGASTTIKHFVTFYGWPDNSPPGTGIALPVIHRNGAGGVGSYADPVTFASDPREWPRGTILYVPYLQRYVIMEDTCAQCITDWGTMKYHIDVWVNSDGTQDQQTIACENSLTRSNVDVEINPPADRPVVTTPLLDPNTGQCFMP